MAARLPDGLRRKIDQLNPDILHVHWVGHAFMRPETLRGLQYPIVWTLHDSVGANRGGTMMLDAANTKQTAISVLFCDQLGRRICLQA
jgi:hypothetical protein